MRFRITGLALCVAAAACSQTDVVVPPTYPAYAIADTVYTYACSGWSPKTPPVKRTLLDIRFGADVPGGTAPPAAARQTVEYFGGQIIYIFNVSTIRAAMDVDSVGALMRTKGARVEFVQTVTKPNDHTVFVNVTLTRTVTEADLNAARQLGATDAYLLPPSNMFRVTIDDSLIPALKQGPDVQYVYWGWGIGCAL